MACTRSKAMIVMFVNEPMGNNLTSTAIKIDVPYPMKCFSHRLQNSPNQWNRSYTANPPTNISITAKFIIRYVLRLRRLRFLIKTITVQRLSVTIATDSTEPTVIQGMHSDKDLISKLRPLRIAVGSNFLSSCGKKGIIIARVFYCLCMTCN